jgi:hypothetical protein
MGAIRPPRPVNLFCGMIGNDRDLLAHAARLLRKQFGETDQISPYWPFDATDYYAEEMGEGLERQFVSFERLINPEELPHIKRITNEIEERIIHDLALPPGRRPVNLDPGYLTLSKIVLATTKDFAHRLYLREGIYGENTLRYKSGIWHAWPWTYPDYADGRYHAFFSDVRERYRHKLNATSDETAEHGGSES